MINHYDIAYGLGVGIAAPFWLVKPAARRKVLTAFRQRMGKVPARDLSHPAIMIHAVSLGEINATRSLIDLIRKSRPALHFIVSVTTETGYARGGELYGSAKDVTLVRYPLDFTPAVDRLLTTLKPSLVVLLELEVWPNFIRRCHQRGVPVLLINGRITEASFRKYRLAKPLVGPMFNRLEQICAQDQTYARRFIELGAAAKRVSVTGTMKFDTATIADRIDGQEALAAAVGLLPQPTPDAGPIGSHPRIWVCGSTGPGEEQIILPTYRNLLARWPDLRLVIVPRHPPRFDEVADLIRASGLGLIRRSETKRQPASAPSGPGDRPTSPASVPAEAPMPAEPPSPPTALSASAPTPSASAPTPSAAAPTPSASTTSEAPTPTPPTPPIILGDTIGELRTFYALAEIVFVGRTLVDLGPRQHGSDMIEPAALAKPVLVGPFTTNFTDAMTRLQAADAITLVPTPTALEPAVTALLESPATGQAMGRRAQTIVRQEQGATGRNVEIILKVVGPIQRP
jgi:3-deoxy-D-manno-octulosonic-acid transferase